MTGDISVTGTTNLSGASAISQWHIVRLVLLNMQFCMSNIDSSFCLFSKLHLNKLFVELKIQKYNNIKYKVWQNL